MGLIRIEISGSFGNDSREFSAENGGHANAVAQAISLLVDILPAQIEKDHKLHEEGHHPGDIPFGQARLEPR